VFNLFQSGYRPQMLIHNANPAAQFHPLSG
jgi:hypothetical protein